MNKLSKQTTILTQQTHMHRFKGERAESHFLQHSARNQVIKHTSRRLQAPFMCSIQGNKHVMQSTSFNMWTFIPVWEKRQQEIQSCHINPSLQSRSCINPPDILQVRKQQWVTSCARELTHANTKLHWKNNRFYETPATPPEHSANFS